MGCTGSKVAGDPEKQRTMQIDAQLKQDRAADKNRIKILLLGAGESGKSTVIKQMRLMYEGTYTDSERDEYRDIIWSNTVQSMQAVLDASKFLEVPIDDPNMQEHAALVLRSNPLDNTGGKFDPALATAISELWANPAVKTIIGRANEIQLNDSATYYFEAVDRLSALDYVPTDSDILRSRVKTTGIQESMFKVDRHLFCLFDVGGQRSERKKWIHCFENVNVLLFLAAISEYDQLLYEDESVARIAEAMTLFDSIANSRWFEKSTIMLFLNKSDLFAQKLALSPLNQYLPEYKGDNTDFKAASAFMLQLFSRLYQPRGHRALYTHFTCATDTGSLRAVLRAVQDTILKERFADAGLI